MSSKAPSEDWQKDAETLHRAMDALDQVMNPASLMMKKPGFHEIYAYVLNPEAPISEQLAHALKHDLKTRRDIKTLLQKQNLVDLGLAVAASTGDIQTREADGYKLTLKPSQAQKGQLYLIIETIDRDDIPSLLFVEHEDGFHRLIIEDFYEGQAQILLNEQEDLVKALRHPKSHVILT